MIASLIGHAVSLGKSLTPPSRELIGFMSGDVVYAIEPGPQGVLWLTQGRQQIYIWHVIRETEQILYAFATAEDRNLALQISTIDGFGPKGTANAVHTLGASDLMKYVANRDTKGLQAAVKGLGTVGANRLITHLKDNLIVTLEDPRLAITREAQAALAALGHTVDLAYLYNIQLSNNITKTSALIERYLRK